MLRIANTCKRPVSVCRRGCATRVSRDHVLWIWGISIILSTRSCCLSRESRNLSLHQHPSPLDSRTRLSSLSLITLVWGIFQMLRKQPLPANTSLNTRNYDPVRMAPAQKITHYCCRLKATTGGDPYADIQILSRSGWCCQYFLCAILVKPCSPAQISCS